MLTIAALMLFNTQAFSQVTGTWKTIDDAEEGKEKSYVEVFEKDGLLYGKIIKIMDEEKVDNVCEECKDHRKDQPILGMQIMEGLKKSGKYYKGGKILDPENGKIYTCRVWINDEGALKVRGYLGPLYRTQTWYRVK